MTTKKCSPGFIKLFLFIISFSLFSHSVFSQETVNWVISAEKFTYSKGQNQNSITKGISETIPKNILENLNKTIERNIKSDERLERTRYDLRTKRQSLYLQLSSEYKKRDSLFLSYSGKKLEKKIKEQEKTIKDIENKIDENLQQLKDAELKAQNPDANKVEKKSFFKRIISNEKAVINSESINIYNNDSQVLFEPSENARNSGYGSALFEKEIYGKGINSLITGNITSYGDYISVSVDLYLYPGAKKIGSVMEVGSFDDLELITSSIVRQLLPIITNSMPVTLRFSITPEDAGKSVQIYIDDILQKVNTERLIINSGIHTFKIASEGYKALSVSYNFEGNTKYQIDVNLEPKNEGNLTIDLKKPLLGNIYVNGVLSEKINETRSKIVINGSQVLGLFQAEDGNSSFFYIPKELYFDGNAVKINPKPVDRAKKIDTRRKWMYGAYSAFMISLIPNFIVKGEFFNQAYLYNNDYTDYNTAKKWQTAANVCDGISIGLGVFWGIELIRYLIAANSVLPEKAKQVDLIDFKKYENQNELDKEKEIENLEKDVQLSEIPEIQDENKSNNENNGVNKK